jgi:hypothetical protein
MRHGGTHRRLKTLEPVRDLLIPLPSWPGMAYERVRRAIVVVDSDLKGCKRERKGRRTTRGRRSHEREVSSCHHHR